MNPTTLNSQTLENTGKIPELEKTVLLALSLNSGSEKFLVPLAQIYFAYLPIIKIF